MIVKSIKLKNYRNFKELETKLNPKLNIFIGNNGQGKTNLLESIFLCSIGKSFRANNENDLIHFHENNFEVNLGVDKINDSLIRKISFDFKKNSKKNIKINDINLEKMSELVGILNTVIFIPDDLRIIKGSPTERRRFINIDISQIKPKYKYLLKNYKKVLNQRNSIIKNLQKNQNKQVLEVWDEYIVNIGTELIYYRKKYIEDLNKYAAEIYDKISNGAEIFDLKYKCNIGNIEDLNKEEIRNLLRDKLKDSLESDIYRNCTLIGPHKDDIVFKINNKDFKFFGSQGQQRSAVLAIKLAEIEIVEDEIGEYPVLLLDDVLSELDNNRKKFLMDYIVNIQTIITSTDDKDLRELLENREKNVFYIKNGLLEKLEV